MNPNYLLVIFALILFGYFFPWIVALCRHHRNTTPIFLTNLFFGWSGLGWFVALIWSFTVCLVLMAATPAGAQTYPLSNGITIVGAIPAPAWPPQECLASPDSPSCDQALLRFTGTRDLLDYQKAKLAGSQHPFDHQEYVAIDFCNQIEAMHAIFERNHPDSKLFISCGITQGYREPIHKIYPLTYLEKFKLELNHKLAVKSANDEHDLERKIIKANGFPDPDIQPVVRPWRFVSIHYDPTPEISELIYEP